LARSGWGRIIRECYAESLGRGGYGAVGGPKPHIPGHCRREDVHINPTKAGAPKVSRFQKVTDFGFGGNGCDGRLFKVENRFRALGKFPQANSPTTMGWSATS
jgi:hypothetical protein